jgi:hypothetical protein
MIVPSTRLFTAGEVETGAFLNSAVTNLGNFVLGKPITQIICATTPVVIAANTIVPIQFTGFIVNRDNSWSNVNNTRFTAQTAGYYYLTGQLQWAATTATTRSAYFRTNGTTNITGSLEQKIAAQTTAQPTTTTAQCLVYLNVGDYVELIAYSGTATTLAALATPAFPNTATMSAIWVSV